MYISNCKTTKWSPPRKINIEPENDSLEDDFPLQMRVLSGSMLIFRGVNFSEPRNPTISLGAEIWKS